MIWVLLAVYVGYKSATLQARKIGERTGNHGYDAMVIFMHGLVPFVLIIWMGILSNGITERFTK
jgi:hypothetical protein